MEQLNQGFDPALLRKVEKKLAVVGSTHGEVMTFEQVARQYGLIHIKGWDDEFGRTKRLLEKSIFPLVGAKRIDEVKPAELLYCLSVIEEAGHLDKWKRTLEVCSWIFKYAIKKQYCIEDITQKVKDYLKAK